jgi:hypothetical protein
MEVTMCKSWRQIITLMAVLAAVIAFGLTVGWAGQEGQGAGDAPDIVAAPQCPICGMDRAKFAHSRVLVTYQDGTAFGACSLHCAAIDLAARLGSAPTSIQVGDYDSGNLIDAETARWVMGGDRPGVMTRRAKWAFATQEAAERFMARHGGERADFETALEAAYADMYDDTRMIREKRKRMAHKHQGG